MISFDDAKAALVENGQDHVLRFWDDLNGDECESLMAQVESIDFGSIKSMQSMLANDAVATVDDLIEPSPVVELAELEKRNLAEGLEAIGGKALSRGDVGVVLVAGGQGSRLGFDGPKGAYLLAPISEASLFEIHSRKILALERKYGAEIPFYIMTSHINDAPTRAFFAENDNFGLAADRVLFFRQRMWPALSKDGKFLLDSKSNIFMSPDGHGGTITALQQTGMFDDMDRREIKTLFY